MKDPIVFETTMPYNIYTAYLKEYDRYDLYCGNILLVLSIKKSEVYIIMQLLNGYEDSFIV